MSSPTHTTLPEGHFLNLPSNFSNDLFSPSSGASTSSQFSPFAPNTASTNSADFQVSVSTGFLPDELNLTTLPPRYAVWEKALTAAREAACTLHGSSGAVGERWRKAWREEVGVLVILKEDQTMTILRRAAVVLTFLSAFYVHSQPQQTNKDQLEKMRIPSSISIPLRQVSNLLGLPTICTYATTVLYNVLPLDPTRRFDVHSNVPTTAIETWTGTSSEEGFYVISAQLELQGVRCLSVMRKALDEAFVGDSLSIKRIAAYLDQLSRGIDELTVVMKTMLKHCDPATFYHVIRPWFKGSNADLPGGEWIFEGGEVVDEETGEVEVVEDLQTLVSGPSAGQSSMVHSLDVFLGVDHKGEQDKPDSTFMHRMMLYMPGPHRDFLNHLMKSKPSIRDLVLASSPESDLRKSYDGALVALKHFRDYHMVIVTSYIISPSRHPVPDYLLHLLPPALAEASSAPEVKAEELRGTGGTALIQFLKLCRTRTMEAYVGNNSVTA